MKVIYELRAQCKECALDKVIYFYLPVPEATPGAMYKGHERQFKREIFPEKYDCHHRIKFSRGIAHDFKWDEEKQVPVAR